MAEEPHSAEAATPSAGAGRRGTTTPALHLHSAARSGQRARWTSEKEVTVRAEVNLVSSLWVLGAIKLHS